MRTDQPPPCQLLPPDARDALIRASRVVDEQQRRIAIDQAAEEARRRYPDLFQPEPAL